jgi:hypothetical protein
MERDAALVQAGGQFEAGEVTFRWLNRHLHHFPIMGAVPSRSGRALTESPITGTFTLQILRSGVLRPVGIGDIGLASFVANLRSGLPHHATAGLGPAPVKTYH